MTQQSEAVSPHTPTVYSRPLRVLIVGFLAILAFGLGHIIYSVRHPPKRLSALELQQRRAALNAGIASQEGKQPKEGAGHNAGR